MATLGDTTDRSVQGDLALNLTRAKELPVVPAGGGTLDSVVINFDSTGDVRVAVYGPYNSAGGLSSATPLLVDLGVRTVTTTDWETWTAGSETLQAGKYYAVAFKSNDAPTVNVAFNSAGSGDTSRYTLGGTSSNETVAFPDPSTGPTFTGSEPVSVYVNYTPTTAHQIVVTALSDIQ